MAEKLGILVSSDKNLDYVINLTDAAHIKGKSVEIFFTGKGVLLTQSPRIKKLIGKKPMTAICLGHQLIALAMGGDTEKLKFGHRGANHPVKDLKTGRVMITSQNHGYVVTEEGMPEGLEVTHVNLNDYTVEGMKSDVLKIYSIQFHPEACPGPHDTDPIFDEFVDLMKGEAIQ